MINPDKPFIQKGHQQMGQAQYITDTIEAYDGHVYNAHPLLFCREYIVRTAAATATAAACCYSTLSLIAFSRQSFYVVGKCFS